jgi:sugar/nucleoside kinase (ribokinase family)
VLTRAGRALLLLARLVELGVELLHQRLADLLAAGDAPVVAVRWANVAAALSTTGFGAVAPLPRPEQVRAALGR